MLPVPKFGYREHFYYDSSPTCSICRGSPFSVTFSTSERFNISVNILFMETVSSLIEVLTASTSTSVPSFFHTFTSGTSLHPVFPVPVIVTPMGETLTVSSFQSSICKSTFADSFSFTCSSLKVVDHFPCVNCS